MPRHARAVTVLLLLVPLLSFAAALTPAEVLRMHASGVGAEVLRAMIETAESVAPVGTEDAIAMSRAGVPGDIVALMVRRGAAAGAVATPVPTAAPAPPVDEPTTQATPPQSSSPVRVVARLQQLAGQPGQTRSGRRVQNAEVVWAVRAVRDGATVPIAECRHDQVCFKRITGGMEGGVTCWCPAVPGDDSFDARFSCAQTLRMRTGAETVVFDTAVPAGAALEVLPFKSVEQRLGANLEEVLVNWNTRIDGDAAHGWVEIEPAASGTVTLELVLLGTEAYDLRAAGAGARVRTAPLDVFPGSPVIRRGGHLDCLIEW